MAPRTESENAGLPSSFNTTARPLAGPMHVNEYYSQPSNPALVSKREVQCSNDRMALYRQHLSALGYTPAAPALPPRPAQVDPAPGPTSPQTGSAAPQASTSTSRPGFFSRRSRRQPTSQQQQGSEPPEDESDSDPEAELARYRADVATAKRGAPPPSQPTDTVRPQFEGSARMAAVAGDVTAVDVMRYRQELQAARQFEASVKDEESRRHFWRKKRKEPPPTAGPVMKGRYC